MPSDPLKELERLPQEWLKSVAETECYESPSNEGLERVATLRRCADELAALLEPLRERIAAEVQAEREACRDLVRDWKFNSKASAQEATTTLMQAIEKRGPFDALERAKEEWRKEFAKGCQSFHDTDDIQQQCITCGKKSWDWKLEEARREGRRDALQVLKRDAELLAPFIQERVAELEREGRDGK